MLTVHTDHLGSPQKITDDTRSIVWDAAFTPFGEEDSITGAETANRRFPGQYHDAEAGLSYNYHRTYDPALGQYLQSDPIGLTGGLNTYSYVAGNPLSNVDPEGEALKIAIGAGIGAGTDFGIQVWQNGGNLDCVDWHRVGMAAALGAAGGPLFGILSKALKGSRFGAFVGGALPSIGTRTGSAIGGGRGAAGSVGSGSGSGAGSAISGGGSRAGGGLASGGGSRSGGAVSGGYGGGST